MTAIFQQSRGVKSFIPFKDQLLTIGDLENFKEEMLNDYENITSMMDQDLVSWVHFLQNLSI